MSDPQVFYIAKRHTPKTCEYCGKPAPPRQIDERCFTGSRLWIRGYHSPCLLNDIYGKALKRAMTQTNGFFSLLRKGARFQGGTYSILVPRSGR